MVFSNCSLRYSVLLFSFSCVELENANRDISIKTTFSKGFYGTTQQYILNEETTLTDICYQVRVVLNLLDRSKHYVSNKDLQCYHKVMQIYAVVIMRI